MLDRNAPNQLPQIIGKSLKILRIFEKIKKIASQDKAVLISGETGTYKELIAKAIHYNSPRFDGPFIIMNMVSIPKKIAEAELFGTNEKALSDRRGKMNCKIDQARGGTLFIYEISEMDDYLQEKLYNFLQNNESNFFEKTDSRRTDTRIICTTNKDLREMVKKGQFRKDLNEIFSNSQIKIPPLRDRKDDILSLARYFLKETAKKFETGQKELSKDAIDFLIKYEWPGNIRELENTIKRAVILSKDKVIHKKDLLIDNIGSCSVKEFLEEKLKRYLKEMTRLEHSNLYENVLSEVEKSLITMVLEETEGNQLKAAKTLGINRNTLRSKIKTYRIRL